MSDETIATGYLRLIPSVDGIQSALGGQFATAGRSASSRFSRGFLPSLKGLLATAGGALLAREVKQFVDKGIASLSRIEVIGAQTESVIKSTGGAANVTRKEIDDLAGALERTTATEAESITQGANLLLTFKNIRNEAGKGNDIFNQTVTSLVDVARAMGTDPKSAAIQLGKALNDPVKGISALTRVGITFSEEQKTLIKRLVESGDVMSAQKIILGELNSQFGGSGSAYAETYAGKVALVGHEYGTLQETILSGVMPALGAYQELALSVLEKINASPALSKFVDKLNSAGEGVVGRLGGIVEKLDELAASEQGITFQGIKEAFPELEPLLSFIETISPLLPTLGESFKEVAPGLEEALPSLTQLVVEVLPALSSVILALLPAIPPLINLIMSLLPLVTSVADVVSPVVQFIADWATGLTDLTNVFNTFLPALASGNGSISDYLNAIAGIKGPVGEVANFTRDLINGLLDFSKGIGDTIASNASTTVRNVKSFVNDIISAVNTAIRGLNSLSSAAGSAIGLDGLNIPTIPLLADGGTITRSGWAMVGEAGPELLNLNAGAQVRPLDNAGDAFTSQGGLRLVSSGGDLFDRMLREYVRAEVRQGESWMAIDIEAGAQ